MTDDVTSAVVFGGSGFIGSHLVRALLAHGVGSIRICDVVPPREPLGPAAAFVKCDVREEIDPAIAFAPETCVFNLAAVHRTPGHPSHEYYDTNERGARNIVAFCERARITRVWFTSSIAVYGPSESPTTERSELNPTSAYGQSKVTAERIHFDWMHRRSDRRLVVVRPATVFGPGERGNFTRLAKSLRSRLFLYPGRDTTLKACGYVDDLVRSLFFMEDKANPSVIYNFAYPTPPTIKQVCAAFSEVAGYPMPLGKIPLPVILGLARLLTAFGLDTFSPERVLKLVRSTNVMPELLQNADFAYGGTLEEAFATWLDAPPRGVFE